MNGKNHLFIISSGSLIFLLFLLLYLSTAAPGIVPGANGGELTVAGSTLGIAHPTGYPLWINLAHFAAAMIPLGTTAWRINALMSILGALSLTILFRTTQEFKIHPLASLSAVTVLGTHLLFWQQTTAAEVYGLHIFMISLFFMETFLVTASRLPGLTKLTILPFISRIAVFSTKINLTAPSCCARLITDC